MVVIYAKLTSINIELKEEIFVNKNIFLVTISLLIMMIFNAPSYASTLKKLYQGQMAVSDQSRTSRDKAVSQIFEQVLVKISGQSKVAQHPQIKKSLRAALSFATEFSFDVTNDSPILTVEFNETLVDNLLISNGITIWDVRRPTVMLWIVYEDEQGERQVLSPQSNELLVKAVKNAAAMRGLPLLLPIWDLDDQLNVSTGDIWGQFESKVAVANARYSSDYMILAKVTSYDISQQVSWSVFKMSSAVDIFGQSPSKIAMTGNDETSSIDKALTQIVSQSTDYFASLYSVDTSEEEGDLLITLINVNSLNTYAQILDYLTSIKAVEEVILVNNKAKEYRFKIKLLGNKKSFLDVISLESRMARITNYDPSLVLYQWRG